MKIELEPVQRGLQSVRRLWRNPIPFSKRGGGSGLEECDPVGEFLAAGGGGPDKFREEVIEEPALPVPEPSIAEVGSYNAGVVETPLMNQEQGLGEQGQAAGDLGMASFGVNEGGGGQPELEMGGVVPLDNIAPQGFDPEPMNNAAPPGYDAGSQGLDPGVLDNTALPVESESDILEAALMMDNPAPPDSEAEGQGAEMASPPPAGNPQGSDSIDDLLDIFKSEEIVDNPLSKLARELPNVDIHSLLNDVMKVAADFGIESNY